jgi:hypothetical protein
VNSSATAAVTLTISDQISISGSNAFSASVYPDTASHFAAGLADRGLIVTAEQPLDNTAGSITEGFAFTIQRPRYADGSFTIRATNGANYSPALPEINATVETVAVDARANRYHWSELEQPEAVPPLNYDTIGSGTIYRAIATRDCIYVFCSDGLYRISGDAGEWRDDPVDPQLVLAARGAVDKLGEVVWAYTERGLVSLVSDQITEHTTGVISDLVPGALFADTWDTYLACDELHREVWLTLRASGNSVSYVFNTFTKAFTSVDTTTEWSAMAYSRALQSLVIGSVSTNPDVLYFEADTSATRMAGADVRYQPITGDGDAHTLKEWGHVDYLFEGIGSAATLVPTFSGTAYTAVTVAANSIESRKPVTVPRNAPRVSARITPGFTLSAGGTAQNWSFRGISVRFEPASEQGAYR